MIRLLLVRHGQTDGNLEGRYQGRTDIELNPVGRDQAGKLAQRLSSQKIDRIYSSSLKRAMQTAEAVAAVHNMPVIPRDELRELDVGDFEGKRVEEIQREYGPLDQMWREGDWRAPGGESLGEFRARVAQFVAEIRQGPEDQTVLAVAHGGTLRNLVCECLGIGPQDWWRIDFDSTSISLLELYPNRTILVLLNDTCHLGAQLGPGIGRYY